MNSLEKKGYAKFIIDMAAEEIANITKSLMLSSGQKAEAIKKCKETRNANLQNGEHLQGLCLVLLENEDKDKVSKRLVREYGYNNETVGALWHTSV